MDRRARVNAILANGGYLQSEEGVKARADEIRQLEDDFDEIVDQILNPQPDVDLNKNPFFKAGSQGLDHVRWQYEARVEQEAIDKHLAERTTKQVATSAGVILPPGFRDD